MDIKLSILHFWVQHYPKYINWTLTVRCAKKIATVNQTTLTEPDCLIFYKGIPWISFLKQAWLYCEYWLYKYISNYWQYFIYIILSHMDWTLTPRELWHCRHWRRIRRIYAEAMSSIFPVASDLNPMCMSYMYIYEVYIQWFFLAPNCGPPFKFFTTATWNKTNDTQLYRNLKAWM